VTNHEALKSKEGKAMAKKKKKRQGYEPTYKDMVPIAQDLLDDAVEVGGDVLDRGLSYDWEPTADPLYRFNDVVEAWREGDEYIIAPITGGELPHGQGWETEPDLRRAVHFSESERYKFPIAVVAMVAEVEAQIAYQDLGMAQEFEEQRELEKSLRNPEGAPKLKSKLLR
jgi:hypothetical protein